MAEADHPDVVPNSAVIRNNSTGFAAEFTRSGESLGHILQSLPDALSKSEERFSLAVQGTDAGIWGWDLRTNSIFFSVRWKSMLGYREDEIAGQYAECGNAGSIRRIVTVP